MADTTSVEREVGNAALVVVSETKSPEELAAAIGLQPDRHWRRGEVVGELRPRVNKLNGVEYYSRLPRETDPHDHLQDLLERVRPHSGELRQLANAIRDDEGLDVPIRLWFSHQTGNYTPGYEFSPDQLELIASLGAFFGISLFVNEAILSERR